MFLKSRKYFFLVSSILFILLLCALMVVSCSKKAGDKGTDSQTGNGDKDGFTFFDLGAQSRLSDGIREKLSEKLGDGTIAEWTTIDLSINYKEFLEQYFDDIYQLNLKLNDTRGARIEHNISDITYRYPPKEKTPFEYVRLIFSNYTHKPLFFRIRTEKEGEAIAEALKSKYNEPMTIEWKNAKGTSLYWRDKADVLIFSKTTNRIGNPEFHINIYFVANIKEMIATEELDRIKREEALKKEGKSAF